LAGERAIQSALLQSDKLFALSTGDAHRKIKPIFERLLKKEGNFNRPGPVGLGREGASPMVENQRMYKMLQPNKFSMVREHALRDGRTVHRTILKEDRRAIALAEADLHRIRSEHSFPHNRIRIEAAEAERLEDPRCS